MDTTTATTADLTWDDWNPAADPAASEPGTVTDLLPGTIVHHVGVRWKVETHREADGVQIITISTADPLSDYSGMVLFRTDDDVRVEDEDVTDHLAGKHSHPVHGCRACEIEWDTCGNCDEPIEKGSGYCSQRCADYDLAAP